MSSFLFSEEQEMFRETVRRLATRAFRDSYLERARSERFPSEAYAELAANGLCGLGAATAPRRSRSSSSPAS